jgi:long-chain fatty acid transport protein
MNLPSIAAARTASYALGWIAFLYSGQSPAAAAWLTESGGADMAMASAGRAAFATDATTIAANPAGMAGLEGSGLVAVVLPVSLDLPFRGSGAMRGTAVSETSAVPMGSLFATRAAGRWTVGLGAYSYLGLGFDFGRQWVGRRTIEDAQLRSFNLAPAVACRLTDRLDVGASIGAQYADAQAGLAVSNDALFYGPPAGLPEGQLRLNGQSWAAAGNLGLAYQADASTKVGLAWTSGVSHSMDLDIRASGLHPLLAAAMQQGGTAKLDFDLPQQFTLSAARQVSPDTLLAASVGWQQWSRFGHANLEFAGQSAPLFDAGLRNTWNVAIGLRHRVDPRWTLATGIAYDSDPSANGTMPIYFPVAEQLRLAAGVDYEFSETLLLRAALSVISQGDVRIAQDAYPVPLPGIAPVTGSISDSRIYVLGFTADYRQ